MNLKLCSSTCERGCTGSGFNNKAYSYCIAKSEIHLSRVCNNDILEYCNYKKCNLPGIYTL